MNSIGSQFRFLVLLVRLELSYLKVERWIVISCLAFCLILGGELLLTSREMDEFQASAIQAQQEARQNWLNQNIKGKNIKGVKEH